jgi:hypothetical protein
MLILKKENLMAGTHNTHGGEKTWLQNLIRKASWEENFWEQRSRKILYLT